MICLATSVVRAYSSKSLNPTAVSGVRNAVNLFPDIHPTRVSSTTMHRRRNFSVLTSQTRTLPAVVTKSPTTSRYMHSGLMESFIAKIDGKASIAKDQLIIDKLPEELRDNKKFILILVSLDGKMLQLASERLKNDPDVYYEAMRTSGGMVLEYAGDKLKDERQVVLHAIRESHGLAVKFASDGLKNDPSIIQEALKDAKFLKRKYNEFHYSVHIRKIYDQLGEEIRTTKELARKAVEINATFLKELGPELQDDEDVVRAAYIKGGHSVGRWASKRLQESKEFIQSLPPCKCCSCRRSRGLYPSFDYSDHFPNRGPYYL